MSFLFVDRILEFTPGKQISGVKTIRDNEPYLSFDEDNRPYFPAALIGETLGQLAAWNVMHTNHFTLRPVAGVVASARLHRNAYVGDCLHLESTIESLDDRAVLYHSTAYVNHEPIVEVEAALGPLLPMEDFISLDIVKKQFHDLLGSVDNSKVCTKPTYRELFTTSMAFDEILSQDAQTITAKKRIDPNASYLPDHFPLKPVLPMTILLESKIALARQFLSNQAAVSKYQIVELRKIKMNVFVNPNDELICYAKIKEQSENQIILTFKSEVNQKRVCVLEMVINYE